MRRVLPLIAVLSLAFAPAPFPKRAKKDSEATDIPSTKENRRVQQATVNEQTR
jgi:hypothetical protein